MQGKDKILSKRIESCFPLCSEIAFNSYGALSGLLSLALLFLTDLSRALSCLPYALHHKEWSFASVLEHAEGFLVVKVF